MVSCFSFLPRHQCRYYPVLSDPRTSPYLAALPSFSWREQVCGFARQGWWIWEDGEEGREGTAWTKVWGASVRGKARSWLEQRVDVLRVNEVIRGSHGRLLKKIFFWLHTEVGGTLVPQPGVEPVPPALEGRVSITEPPGNQKNFKLW